MPPYQKLPPLLPVEQAEAQGVMVLGTCDWGGCHREAWGARWDRETGQYLTVCRPCSRSNQTAERSRNTTHPAEGEIGET